jgi:hypothetical protein
MAMEFFLPLRAGSGRGKPVREEMRWDGGDGEADPRERKKKLDENVVLVSFVLSVEITKSLITYIYI